MGRKCPVAQPQCTVTASTSTSSGCPCLRRFVCANLISLHNKRGSDFYFYFIQTASWRIQSQKKSCATGIIARTSADIIVLRGWTNRPREVTSIPRTSPIRRTCSSDLTRPFIAPPVPWQAYAKLHGTYESINGGSVGEALVDLTGGCCEKISFTSGKQLMDVRPFLVKPAADNRRLSSLVRMRLSLHESNCTILSALTPFVIHRQSEADD